MFEMIIAYVSIWAPSLVAVLSMVGIVLSCLKEARNTFKSFREDKTLIDLVATVQTLSADNKELQRTVKLLLDRETKIKGYADAKNKED